MNKEQAEAQARIDAIRCVLVEDWDPIGVMDDPEWPRDEYDAYIPLLRAILEREETTESLARHLCLIEDRRMGLGAPPVQARMEVARNLQMLDLARGGHVPDSA